MQNYTNNLLRFGFTEQDIAEGGSDRLIDTIIPHGSAEQIAAAAHEPWPPGPTTSACRRSECRACQSRSGRHWRQRSGSRHADENPRQLRPGDYEVTSASSSE